MCNRYKILKQNPPAQQNPSLNMFRQKMIDGILVAAETRNVQYIAYKRMYTAYDGMYIVYKGKTI